MKRRIEVNLLNEGKNVSIEIKEGQSVHIAHHIDPDKLFISIAGKEYYSEGSIFINDVI
ncbi:MAG: hypothetical protein PHH73_00260 [Candidatus Rickettsiella isopodorum]|nr:hypothetical protein [Candidatus Rickettsiella isopodorum]